MKLVKNILLSKRFAVTAIFEGTGFIKFERSFKLTMNKDRTTVGEFKPFSNNPKDLSIHCYLDFLAIDSSSE